MLMLLLLPLFVYTNKSRSTYLYEQRKKWEQASRSSLSLKYIGIGMFCVVHSYDKVKFRILVLFLCYFDTIFDLFSD